MRRGFYNWDRIVYRYYKDEVVSTEAFKAGEYDLVKVYSAPIWARQHRGPKWDDGRIVKKALETSAGKGLQAYELNLRRPIFADLRVRHALALTYDFENNNRYGRLKRANSVFNNSEFAAEGLPSPGELKLLEPYRDELPEGGVRPGVPRAAQRHRRRTRCADNLLAARALLAAGRLEARRRRRPAQREGRAVRVRVPVADRPGHRPRG